MKKPMLYTEDEILGRLLHTSAKLFKRLLAENLHAAGFTITVEEAITMGILYTEEGLSQQGITNIINCEKTAMTRIIDKLEESKLVKRISDKEDRRQNKIFLTKSGKSLVRKFFEVAQKTEKQAFSDIPADRIKLLKETLIDVRANLFSIVDN